MDHISNGTVYFLSCIDVTLQSDEMRLLHRLTCQCIQFLSKESYLREEGLFRVPGNLVKLKQIRQKFLSGKRL